MSPPGTPVARTSPSRAALAVSRGSANVRSPAAARARVSATESAELDESPEPPGPVELVRKLAAVGVRPRPGGIGVSAFLGNRLFDVLAQDLALGLALRGPRLVRFGRRRTRVLGGHRLLLGHLRSFPFAGARIAHPNRRQSAPSSAPC